MKEFSIEDELAIRNLVSRYSITTDNADVDGFMDCWVAADEFEGYDSGSFGNLQSWDELRAFEEEHVGENGMARGKRHQATNLLIQPKSASEAWVTHDLLVLDVENIPGLIATGRYNNSLVVKTEKGWKFKKRKLEIDAGFFKLMEQWKAAAQ